jgi:sec-independent protein translocase protein TatB
MGISPPIEVANLGMADSLILMVLALVVFGPRRLPQIGRQIGKLMYEFRKASNDFKFQMEEELRNAEDADRRRREEAERQRSLTLVPPPQPAATQADSPAAESGTAAEVAPPASIASEVPGAEADNSYETYADSAAAYESQAPAEMPAPGGSVASVEPLAPAENAAPAPLQVHPPATGEPVPAARPGSAIDSVPSSVTTAAEQPQVGRGPEPAAAPAEVNHHETEAAAEVSDAAAEPAAHHG